MDCVQNERFNPRLLYFLFKICSSSWTCLAVCAAARSGPTTTETSNEKPAPAANEAGNASSRVNFNIGADDESVAAPATNTVPPVTLQVKSTDGRPTSVTASGADRTNEQFNEFADVGSNTVFVTPKKDPTQIAPSASTASLHKSASKWVLMAYYVDVIMYVVNKHVMISTGFFLSNVSVVFICWDLIYIFYSSD